MRHGYPPIPIEIRAVRAFDLACELHVRRWERPIGARVVGLPRKAW